MNKNDVLNILSNELSSEINFKDNHGINKSNLNDYLIPPYKRLFFNAITKKTEELWVVFDELKESDKDGYIIFYSEEDSAFGLATKRVLQCLTSEALLGSMGLLLIL